MNTSRRGFTLVELLIVVVIIGLLSAMAVPRFAATKEKAYLASMKSDLRNLVTAQESFLGDNLIYYSGAIPNAAFPYVPSSGNTATIVSIVPGGWSASIASTGTVRTCAIFYGTIAPLAPATTNGEPKCT